MNPKIIPPTENSTLLKKAASSLQPDVWFVPDGQQPFVIKTFERSPLMLRATICRWMAQRERKNLGRLEAFPETPQLMTSDAPWSIRMTYLDTEPVSEKKGALPSEYFDALEDFLERMHQRGLNHGDLRRKNLMSFRNGGLPAMVDFAQCLYFPNNQSVGYRLIMRRAIDVDRLTFLKLKAWYLGDGALTEEELRVLDDKPRHLKFGQFLKKKIYRPYKHWRQGKKPKRRSARK